MMNHDYFGCNVPQTIFHPKVNPHVVFYPEQLDLSLSVQFLKWSSVETPSLNVLPVADIVWRMIFKLIK